VKREAAELRNEIRFTSDESRVRTQAPSGVNSTGRHDVEKGAAELRASFFYPTMM
jgi:hypothetical protein